MLDFRIALSFLTSSPKRAFSPARALQSSVLQATRDMTAPRAVRSSLDLIGHTPMVELTHFDTGPCRLFAKLEGQNPRGSIKDRIGLSMIQAAEKAGALKPPGTTVEATAGNAGLRLAACAPARRQQRTPPC